MGSSEEKMKYIEQPYLRNDLPDFKVGDFIKMKVKVIESDKVRIHPFEGTVIRKKGQGLKSTFTVRKLSFGEGVERTFPLYSPTIENITVISHGNVKRARLYYLRDRSGKSARIKNEAAVTSQQQK